MTIRHLSFALAAMGLLACSHDEAAVEDANDENQQMQGDQANRDSYSSGNLAASSEDTRQTVGMQPMNPSMSPGPDAPVQGDVHALNQDLTSPTTSPATQPDAGLCEGVEQPEACPVVADGVRRASNIESGIMLTLRGDPATLMAPLERRIRCFESRTTTRSADAECLLAMPGVSAVVSEDAGTMRMRLVTTDPAQVQGLRQRGRTLGRRTGGGAHTAPAAESGTGGSEPGGAVRGNDPASSSPATSPGS